MTSFVFWGAPTFVCGHFCYLHAFGDPTESGRSYLRLQRSGFFKSPSTIFRHNFNDSTDKVSLDRIASFLRLDELNPDAIENLPRGSSGTAIEIRDANFSWDLSSPTQH
ncbi:hypothetical protein M0R45_019593 [Rubus argutus]|uniref:Uncharacterized protein n=1 Tax=Rubus argutus TaxID=59490 RepID=A0AAW1X8K9_RUBAR